MSYWLLVITYFVFLYIYSNSVLYFCIDTYCYSLHLNYLYLILFTHENQTYLEYDDWGNYRKKTNTFVY